MTTSAIPVDQDVAVTSRQLGSSDPCGFLAGLSKIGTVKFDRPHYSPLLCQASVEKAYHDVSVEFVLAQPGKRIREQGGIPVYRGKPTIEDDCSRQVAAATDTLVVVERAGCTIVNRVIDDVVTILRRAAT